MNDDAPAPGTALRRPFRVLCVCEGNICRSPVAAVLLREALGAGVEVGSAGTGAVVGAPVAPPMRALLLGRGLDPDGFAARQLEAEHLRRADLVLTMTTPQRGAAVSLVPGVVRRTFTVRELARLLDAVDPATLPAGPVADRLRAALPVAAARRRYVVDPRADDIADPYGRHDTAYRRAFDEVVDAVDRISRVVAPDGTAQSPDRATAGSRAAGGENDAGGTTERDAASTST